MDRYQKTIIRTRNWCHALFSMTLSIEIVCDNKPKKPLNLSHSNPFIKFVDTMANPKCDICGKTAYPLESVKAIEKTYHKWCFKCMQSLVLWDSSFFSHFLSGTECGLVLNLKNFKGRDGKVYCFTHTPVDRTSVANPS